MTEEYNNRIASLERWRNQIDVERAAESVGIRHLDKRLEDIEKSITWLNRSFWGGVLVVVATYALKGGFTV